MTGLPLEGLRVLAAEQMQALPFATQLLGFLGAEVVKIEHPARGDSGRGSRPSLRDVDGRDVGATYLRNNLGKRSIGIDLARPEGAELVRRLVPGYDVFAENFRAGALGQLGLGYEALAALHPGLVYVSVSGFGNLGDSPYRERPAYAVVAEAMGGLYELQRQPDDPVRLGSAGAFGDIGSGLFATVGLLAALRERERTGRGRHVDVAMFDAVVSMLDLVPFLHSMGIPKLLRRDTPGVFDAFACCDGLFVVQAVREHQLERFARAVGHPEWLDDPRFARREGWTEQLEAVVRPAVEAWAAGRTKTEVASALSAAGVPCGPSHDAEEIVRDPHVRERGVLLDVERPDGGPPLRVPACPIRLNGLNGLDGAPSPDPVRWPALGAHTDEILREELDLGDAELDCLRRDGVISGG